MTIVHTTNECHRLTPPLTDIIAEHDRSQGVPIEGPLRVQRTGH